MSCLDRITYIVSRVLTLRFFKYMEVVYIFLKVPAIVTPIDTSSVN